VFLVYNTHKNSARGRAVRLARQSHKLKVVGSNPAPAIIIDRPFWAGLFYCRYTKLHDLQVYAIMPYMEKLYSDKPFGIVDGIDIDSPADIIQLKAMVDHDLGFVHSSDWDTNVGSLDEFKPFIARYLSPNSDKCLFVRDDCYANIVLNRGRTHIYVRIAGPSEEAVKGVDTYIRSIASEIQDNKKNISPVHFWTNSGNGPVEVTRRIAVPDWEEIKINYSSEVREKLDYMMKDFKPSHGGQLVIWEGDPGTGKTYSLRALAEAWKPWADFHYISDPEEFFGSAAYMFHVLLKGKSYDPWDYEDEPKKDDKWNVLILEDCGELLAADAKVNKGQAVSRLLNVVDGLIGQGLKILVLVTTNEPVKKFDPAIMRPGRCAMTIDYKALNEQEIQDWFEDKNLPVPDNLLDKSATVAELYGAIEGFEVERRSTATLFGFAA
jgi:hypothetical protein